MQQLAGKRLPDFSLQQGGEGRSHSKGHTENKKQNSENMKELVMQITKREAARKRKEMHAAGCVSAGSSLLGWEHRKISIAGKEWMKSTEVDGKGTHLCP